jgi:hypothetical protein
MTGLALMALAWNIVDTRYRFRTFTAPLPIRELSYGIVVLIGVSTLMTDLWRAQRWYVPRGNVVTPAEWQALLALIYVVTFLTWAYFAFIRPPKFTKRSANRFDVYLKIAMLRGSSSELAIVASELARTVASLVEIAPDWHALRRRHDASPSKKPITLTEVEEIADDILRLIANPRFCRVVVETASDFAFQLFETVRQTRKYGVNISAFAKNALNEAIANKDSFIYAEMGYDSGLISDTKPIMQAMFSDYAMVEAVGTLEPSWSRPSKWESAEWEAYCNAVLMALESYIASGRHERSHVLHVALDSIKRSASDLYKIDGKTESEGFESPAYARLGVTMRFFKDAIKILNEKDLSPPKKAVPEHYAMRTFYDELAEAIAEVIFYASKVKSPADLCWWIQHNMVWVDLFRYDDGKKKPSRVIQHKLRRFLYNDIVEMTTFPNYKGATTLGFCLNVFGFTVSKKESYASSTPLQIAALRWTKAHFARIYEYDPKIAAACLVDGFAYESDNLRIVRTHESGMRRIPTRTYFEVDPPPTSAPPYEE